MSKEAKETTILKRVSIGSIAIWFIILITLISLVMHVYVLQTRLEIANKIITSDEGINIETEYEIYEACQNILLKRDIEIYIKARYTRTPKVVAKSIAENVILYSGQYGISPELVIGIIEVESGFNPMVISKKDARGLMQVMPEWAPKFKIKVNDLHDIDIGIESGIKVFLIHLEEAKGNISKGLYYYVGKDKTYSNSVYTAVGRFVSFRSTIGNEKKVKIKPKNMEINDDIS